MNNTKRLKARVAAALVCLVAAGLLLFACKGGLRPGLVHCGSLELSTLPTGARVWLDTIAVEDTTDCVLESIPAGKYRVTFQKPGFLGLTVQVEIIEGKLATIETTLVAQGDGKLQVKSTPTGARVWLDNIYAGDSTDCLLDSISPGAHSVRLTKPGYADWYCGVTVLSNKTTLVSATLARSSGAIRVGSTPIGALVWLDNSNTGMTTNCILDNVQAGSHLLKLNRHGYEDWDTTVLVVADETTQVDAILSGVTSGWLLVNSSPVGADVWLDDTSTGQTTNCLIAGVSAGAHPVKLTMSRYEDWDSTATVVIGETAVVYATLAAADEGWISINSSPTGASVWVDSINTGLSTNCVVGNIPAGPHTLTLVKTGYIAWDSTLTVLAGDTVSVNAQLSAVPQSWIQVSSTPTGADVWLDSSSTGRTTDCLLAGVAPGSHVVQLRKPGYATWDTIVTTVADDTTVIETQLSAVSSGWIRANSTPAGAEVWLDDANTGEVTNCLLSDVEAGQHDVRLKLSGYLNWHTIVNVVGGDTVVIDAELSPQPESGLVFIGTNAQGFDEYLWPKDSSVVIEVPAGEFTMGSNVILDEQPIHDVYLDMYYVDKYEVTNRQYREFCDSTSYPYPDDPGYSGMNNYFLLYPDYPVVMVAWVDAQAYATWAGKTLPTEAQWEKAARGIDARTWPWGEAYPGPTYCNWNSGDPYAYTAPVGSFVDGPSFYGAADMAGNAWEWAKDWYSSSYYSVSPDSNPPGPTYGTDRVARGGSYNNDNTIWLRCAERYWGPPTGSAHPALGFRCALVRP